jgi:hypothetical protein
VAADTTYHCTSGLARNFTILRHAIGSANSAEKALIRA